MPERTSYANGVPSWVDVASADVDTSIAFYRDLFGWEHAASGPPEETGGYGMFTLGGKVVAGIMPLANEQQPPVWTTYLAVDDADATIADATEAGGQVAGSAAAGLVQMNEQWPEGVPPHWHVYFVVADADASAARVKELGGSVHVEPFDAPGIGKMSVVSDPTGTHFSIIALAGAPD